MPLYEFSIVATGLNPTEDNFEAAFFEKGADDATISFQRGLIILDFSREAPSMIAALESAIAAVKAAGANIVRIEPDPLVTLSDIAQRAHLTRAAVSLYAKGERSEGFPVPVARVTSESPLWLWFEVAYWLAERGRLSPSIADDAYALAFLTAANERDDTRQGSMPLYKRAG